MIAACRLLNDPIFDSQLCSDRILSLLQSVFEDTEFEVQYFAYDILARLVSYRATRVHATLRSLCEKLMSILRTGDMKVNEEDTLLQLSHFCDVAPMAAHPHLEVIIQLLLPRITSPKSFVVSSALHCFGNIAKVRIAHSCYDIFYNLF